MSRPVPTASEVIRFALADSIAFLNASDWNRVSANSGLFLSRRFLELMEQNRPENLGVHYALAYREGRPVAAIVTQSLDIRVADLSSSCAKEEGQGIWHSLEEATLRSIARGRKRFLLFEALLPWAPLGGADQVEEAPEFGPRWRQAWGAGGAAF